MGKKILSLTWTEKNILRALDAFKKALINSPTSNHAIAFIGNVGIRCLKSELYFNIAKFKWNYGEKSTINNFNKISNI